MRRLTKAIRQEIVREFAVRHNGQFNPTLFVQEVRAAGDGHPAYDWFEWDQNRAALAYQVEQARAFVRDLRVTFSVEEIGGDRKVSVREAVMPLVISPVDGRRHGGGYVLTDPSSPAHMAEHQRQAATALRAWWDRYQLAAVQAGVTEVSVDAIASALESVPELKDAA